MNYDIRSIWNTKDHTVKYTKNVDYSPQHMASTFGKFVIVVYVDHSPHIPHIGIYGLQTEFLVLEWPKIQAFPRLIPCQYGNFSGPKKGCITIVWTDK